MRIAGIILAAVSLLGVGAWVARGAAPVRAARTRVAAPAPAPADLGRSLLAGSGDVDHDGDGLADEAEDRLATALAPYLVFDSREMARRPAEPRVLFQVRPRGCLGPGCGEAAPWTVLVTYALLFRRDGGYGPASWCRNAHPGDNEEFVLEATSTDGRVWWPRPTRLGLPEAHVRGCTSALEWQGSHAVVYLSAGKHHTYASTCVDSQRSPYSRWGCRDSVDGRGARLLAAPGGANVGEPEAHPAEHFAGPLDVLGFPGEDAWGPTPFVGGLRVRSRMTSSMRSLWARHPYEVRPEVSTDHRTVTQGLAPPTR
ncbi:MAG TPA: hypothetical protein VGQ83_32065 [Polyangia bacterium]|jgi:hypothetical protein